MALRISIFLLCCATAFAHDNITNVVSGQSVLSGYHFSSIPGGTSGGSPSYTPSNTPNAELYVSCMALPTVSFPLMWTNEIFNNQMFTNEGTLFPANLTTGSGMQFDGVNGHFFKLSTVGSASGIQWNPATDSTHLVFQATSADVAGSFVCLVGDVSVGGHGVYVNNGVFTCFPGTSFTVVAGVIYDVDILPNLTVFTNGVAAPTLSSFNATPILYGIGQDADGDATFAGKIYEALISTNYTFTTSGTTSDVATNYIYATANYH